MGIHFSTSSIYTNCIFSLKILRLLFPDYFVARFTIVRMHTNMQTVVNTSRSLFNIDFYLNDC
jgi:hypothetical protein